MRITWPCVVVLGGTILAACSTPDVGSDEASAPVLAAAAEIIRGILSNPGSVEAICVDLMDGIDVDSLPGLDPDGVEILPKDGCVVVEIALVKREGGGQAISVSAVEPEFRGPDRARVQIITSTGSNDLAAYACDVRRRDTSWTVEGCDIEAIT